MHSADGEKTASSAPEVLWRTAEDIPHKLQDQSEPRREPAMSMNESAMQETLAASNMHTIHAQPVSKAYTRDVLHRVTARRPEHTIPKVAGVLTAS